MNKKNYRSNGKLLLTGEYLVLKGALALAVPLRFGQTMTVFEKDKPTDVFTWEFHDINGMLLKNHIQKGNLDIIKTNNRKMSSILKKILAHANKISRDKIIRSKIEKIACTIDFDIRWGFGSSSTLLSNLGYWLDIDPYNLADRTFQGSGYDIACARSHTPLLFRRENDRINTESVALNNSFISNTMLIFSGKKQDTRKEIKATDFSRINSHEIHKISEISKFLINAENYDDFKTLITIHEDIISVLLGKPRLAFSFPDYDGVVKPLGAWGGDFFMAASPRGTSYTSDYFMNKGYKNMFTFNDAIL